MPAHRTRPTPVAGVLAATFAATTLVAVGALTAAPATATPPVGPPSSSPSPVPEAVAEMAHTVDDMVLVGEDRLGEAMRLLHQELGLVVEPAGAAGLAAALEMKDRLAGQLVAVPICGGNVAKGLS